MPREHKHTPCAESDHLSLSLSLARSLALSLCLRDGRPQGVDCEGDDKTMEPRRAAFLLFDALLLFLLLYYALFSGGGGRTTPQALITVSAQPSTEPSERSVVTETDSYGGDDQPDEASTAQKAGGRRRAKRSGRGRRRSEPHADGTGKVEQSAARSHQTYTNTGGKSCGTLLADYKCPANPRKAVVTLSTGKRSHFAVTKVPMMTFARKTGADFHVVDSLDHPALSAFNNSLQSGGSSHFIKLPMLRHFLAVYDQVLFVDDDVLISPFAPDLFAQVDCRKLGAVIEAYHVQGWHTMHAKSFCEIYDLKKDRDVWKETCSNQAVKRQRTFNSGVMLLSGAHRPMLDQWEKEPLRCKVLCDQLYMNAMLRRHDVCLDDLGTAFNMPGTQVRKMLTSTAAQRKEGTHLQLRDSQLADACVAHLTVLPSKSISAAYLLLRALTSRDILQCAGKGGPVDQAAMIAQIRQQDGASASEDDVEKLWCAKTMASGCKLIRQPISPSGDAASPSGSNTAGGSGASETGQASTATPSEGLGPMVPAGPSDELPESALAVIRRSAESAWDGKTVTLLFATSDFLDLAINWAQATRTLGLRNFVLVAMDKKLGGILSAFPNAPSLVLPRVASGATEINKLTVIGERQRFGLRVLEAGFNVLFADLDAIFLRSPEPLLRDGDIIGERIWGRPRNVVKKWGAAICTGFYFVRATSANVAIFRKTHFLIAEKRQRQPKWQASDQWAINNALDQQVRGVRPGTSIWPVRRRLPRFLPCHLPALSHASHLL